MRIPSHPLVLAALCAAPSLSLAQRTLPASEGAAEGDAQAVLGAEPPVAFVGVTVVPMDSDRSLPDHTVVTHAGRIVAFGPTEDVEIPRDAIRIEGRDRFLMPGLADMNVHVASGNDLLLFVANGVTTVRNLDGDPSALALRDEVTAGVRLGPTIVTAGASLDSDPPTDPRHLGVKDREDARRVIAEQARAGYDFVRVSAMLPAGLYLAVLEAAREIGIPVAGEAPAELGVEAALRYGQRAIDYASQYVFFHFEEDLEAARIPSIADATRRADVAVVTVLSAYEKALRQMGNAAAAAELLERPEMRFVSPSVRERWGRKNPYVRRERSAYLEAGYRFTARVVEGLHDAGARLVLGTDANEAGNIPGFAVHEELALLVDAGLSPYAALRTATVSPAEMLGQDDLVGTIAVGKRADLILLEGDPLEDVANVARRSGVMVRGHWLPERALLHWLDEVAFAYEPLIQPAARS